jgi:hypothetical protein
MPVPNQWKPKINRHVSYRTAGGKRRPGIITALPGGTNVTIRVGHHAVPETYANVPYGKGAGQYRPG